MNYTNDRNLYIDGFTEIAQMHDDVNYRVHLNSYQAKPRGKSKQYPAVTPGAKYHDYTGVGNHHSPASARDFHDRLLDGFRDKLHTEINNYTAFCDNAVGHCAENYAVQKVIERIEENNDTVPNLQEFSFTHSFEPRTWKKKDWCANCHEMFE